MPENKEDERTCRLCGELVHYVGMRLAECLNVQCKNYGPPQWSGTDFTMYHPDEKTPVIRYDYEEEDHDIALD